MLVVTGGVVPGVVGSGGLEEVDGGLRWLSGAGWVREYCAGGAGHRGGGNLGVIDCDVWGLGFKMIAGRDWSRERRGAVSEEMSGDV